MLTYWRGAFVVSLSALSLGACQVLSGLSDLEAGDDGGVPPTAGSGGMGQGGTGSGGTGAGGDAFAGCDDDPKSCVETFTEITEFNVDVLGIVPDYILAAAKGDSGGGAIARSSIKDKTLVMMLSDISLSHFATYVDRFYWIDTSGANLVVRSESGVRQGADAVTIATESMAGEAQAFAVGEGHAFWSLAGSSSVRWSTGQGDAVADFVMGSAGQQAPTALVFNETFLYWNQMSTAEIRRKDIGPSGSEGTVATGASMVAGMAVDETYLYWSSQGGSMATVNMKLKSDSGGKGIDLGGVPSSPTHITADAGYVYWVDLGGGVCMPKAATVKRISKDSTKTGVVEVAAGLTCPSNFVQDDTFIYIGSGEKILRFPKKQ